MNGTRHAPKMRRTLVSSEVVTSWTALGAVVGGGGGVPVAPGIVVFERVGGRKLDGVAANNRSVEYFRLTLG